MRFLLGLRLFLAAFFPAMVIVDTRIKMPRSRTFKG